MGSSIGTPIDELAIKISDYFKEVSEKCKEK